MQKWESTWEEVRKLEKGKELNQIRAERNRAGMTLEKLAAETGIPTSTLSRYQDSENVPYAALQKIADVLNLPVSALMYKRQIPDGDKLTYDQLNLELQASQQYGVYITVRHESQRKLSRVCLFVITVFAAMFLYILIDRFGFPNAGVFHAG